MMSLSRLDFDYLRRLVRERSAIVLDPDKEYLVEARLGPLLQAERADSLAELVRRLRAGPSDRLCSRVVEAMATHESSFFRDPQTFEAIHQHVLPELLQRRRGAPVGAWSAACAAGQEPYSLAMAIEEQLPGCLPLVRILATDLSAAILARAREGAYNQVEVNRGLPAPLLLRYFEQHGLQWRVVPRIAAAVQFRLLNLAERWPPIGPVDLLLLRNVLIYFDDATKLAVLRQAHDLLPPDGYLFLGQSETLIGLDVGFRRRVLGRAVCYQPERP
jgi:chemotaxis protein methyltransferase CheR